MDELDRSILGLLGADARMSVATLARRLKVARSTIQARLERLEVSGVIAGYTLKLGEGAREGRLRASVLLTIEPRTQAALLTRLKSIAEVERVFTTSGRFDLAAANRLAQHPSAGSGAGPDRGDGGGQGVGKPDPSVHQDRPRRLAAQNGGSQTICGKLRRRMVLITSSRASGGNDPTDPMRPAASRSASPCAVAHTADSSATVRPPAAWT